MMRSWHFIEKKCEHGSYHWQVSQCVRSTVHDELSLTIFTAADLRIFVWFWQIHKSCLWRASWSRERRRAAAAAEASVAAYVQQGNVQCQLQKIMPCISCIHIMFIAPIKSTQKLNCQCAACFISFKLCHLLLWPLAIEAFLGVRIAAGFFRCDSISGTYLY